MAEQMKPSGIDWIGDIPKSWKVTRLQTLFDQVKDKNSGTKEKNLLSLSYGKIVKKDIEGAFGLIPESFDTYNIIKKNDIVLRLTDMQNDQVSLRTGLVKEEKGIITSAYVTIRLKCGSPSYYHWYLYAFDTSKQIYAFGQGVRQSLTFEELKKMLILLPSPKEQQAIADFLDEECAQIDSIAADLEKQIALLQQYKKSLITEIVTKGLDKSVPMKDSGVEWIGEIPEHWEISRVRHLASLCSGATPSKDVLSYWEGNIPWVSSQEVKSDIIKDTSLHISEEAINSCSTQLMPAGTLVMVVRSGILQHTIPVALLGVPATINQDIKAFQFNHLMLPAYFKYYIQGENDALLSVIIKDKTTVESVDNQLLLSLKIMVPPIEEQKAIVAFLNYKCGYIDKILNDKQEQLNLLMQHKKSLIYEYVTGKKRVKEVR